MLQRAMDAVRQRTGAPLSDAEALAAVAHLALSSEERQGDDPTRPSSPVESEHSADVAPRKPADDHTGSPADGSAGTHTGSPADGSAGTHTGSPADGSAGTHTGSPADGSAGTHTGSPADGSAGTHTGSPADAARTAPPGGGDLWNALGVDSADPAEPPSAEAAEERAELVRNASRLFHVMRTRATWTIDEMCGATGFSVQTTSVALLALRLERVVRGGPMRYHVF
jgi:hypothetical protein